MARRNGRGSNSWPNAIYETMPKGLVCLSERVVLRCKPFDAVHPPIPPRERHGPCGSLAHSKSEAQEALSRGVVNPCLNRLVGFALRC